MTKGLETAMSSIDICSARQATIKDKMEMVLDIGQLLMESGGDSKSIVRDMLRAAAYLGLHWKHLNFHMTYTTIMANYDSEKKSYTVFRKCRIHGINMTTIADVSQLSWRALEQKYETGTFKADLEAMKEKSTRRHYPQWATSLAAGIACGGFCKLFGCDWVAFVYTALAACIGFWVRHGCNRFGVNPYISIAASACIATAAAYWTQVLPGSATPWFPMIACMLFLVPGVPLINSFDDLMNNYIVSGMTRAMNTMLVVLAMTFGIVGAISLCQIPAYSTYDIVPDSIYGSQAIAAALAAMGFSVIFNIPPRLLPVAGIGAVMAVGTRNILAIGFDVPMAWASFWGAAIISIVGFKLAGRLRTPRSVVTVPAVIPMIPGVFMYRLLIGIFYIPSLDPQGLLTAIQSGVQAFMIILAIALGATIPDMIAHQFIERSKHQRLCHLLAVARSGEDSAFEIETDIDQASNLK